MIITDNSLHALLDDPRVTGLIDPNMQIQQSGIDLTVKTVERFSTETCGVIDFDNSKRELPPMINMPFHSDGSIYLHPGVYRVNLDPCIPIPIDAMGFAMPRSTLTRMGCGIHSGFWDAGYVGDSTVLLTVYNPAGVKIYHGARIAQLALVRTEGKVSKGYSGVYQGGVKDPKEISQLQFIEEYMAAPQCDPECDGSRCNICVGNENPDRVIISDSTSQ